MLARVRIHARDANTLARQWAVPGTLAEVRPQIIERLAAAIGEGLKSRP